MRTNGYIKPRLVTEPFGGSVEFDEDGVPVVSSPYSEDYGDAIDCWAETNTDEAKGVYEDGEFRRCAYSVLLDTDSFTAKRVFLNKDGEDLGEFRVMQLSKIARMGRIRLMLRQ